MMLSPFQLFYSLLFVTILSAVMVSSHQFPVGGDRGWIQPTPDMPFNTYNIWATRTRFLIGDTLYFKYEDGDSVLVVDSIDYGNCDTTDPIQKYDDGNTIFRFNRSGLFYFISGQTGHCESGQKLVIRVMHASETIPPVLAPAPSPDQSAGGGSAGGGGGRWVPPPPTHSGTTKLSAASCFISFVFSILVIYYWFVMW